MPAMKCDVCGGKVVAAAKEDWFKCEYCETEYPLDWMKAKFQKTQTVKVEGAVEVAGLASVENLYKRAALLLADGRWQDADAYFDKVLDVDAEHASAYVGKLCAQRQVRQESELSASRTLLSGNANYEKALRFGEPSLKAELERINQGIANRLTQDRKRHEQTVAEQQRKCNELRRTLAAEESKVAHIKAPKFTRVNVWGGILLWLVCYFVGGFLVGSIVYPIFGNNNVAILVPAMIFGGIILPIIVIKGVNKHLKEKAAAYSTLTANRDKLRSQLAAAEAAVGQFAA